MRLICFVILLCAHFVFFTQENDTTHSTFKNDLSLSTGISLANYKTFERIGLTYRLGMKQRSLKLKFSANYNRFYYKQSLFNNLYFSSDSLIITNDTEVQMKDFSLKMGVDKAFFERLIVGVDFIFGFGRTYNANIFYGLAYDSTSSEWSSCNHCLYEHLELEKPQIDPTSSSGLPSSFVMINQGDKYLLYGVSLNIGIYQTISKKFDLVVQYIPSIVKYHNIDNNNGFNIFQNHGDVTLRYKF